MKIVVETERLILRELLPTDLEGMYELDADPEVHRYLGNNPVTSREQIVEVIEMVRQQYIDNGIGRWAVVDKKSGEFLGWSGLKLVTSPVNGRVNYYDLGYRLQQKHWGKGIATESAFAALDYAFDLMHLEEVVGIVDCKNIASNCILQKVGMQFVEVFDYDGTAHNWYSIKKR